MAALLHDNVGEHLGAALVALKQAGLSEETELVIYRVAEEALKDAGQHARASMRGRAALVGGRITVGPRAGVGTEVRLAVPT